MAIVAAPLTAEAFVSFGDVVSAPGDTAQRFDDTARLHSDRSAARANLVTVRCVPVVLPLKISLLEQHPHSSQTFIPMICGRYLVCVAPTGTDGLPELGGLRAFICLPGQAINYLAGTWHHPLVVLDAPAQFAMLVWEDGSKDDCVVYPLPEAQIITG